MKVFVVRSKPHNIHREEQFLTGIISIGWPTQMSLKEKGRRELEEVLRSKYPDISQLSVTQVFEFVRIPVGSIILSPSYETRDIHLFKTTSEYRYVSEWSTNEIGNPHVLDAEYIKTVPRSIFSDKVKTALLAAKKTVTEFSKYGNELLGVINDDASIIDTAVVSTSPEMEAKETLRALLKSENDEIRLKAALALLGK